MRDRAAYFKYLYYLTHYITAKKIYNSILNNIEKKLQVTHLKSIPSNVIIEPCNICNLMCPGCITGTMLKDAIEPSMLKFDDFKRIFDMVKEYVFKISMYKQGEPFLNKEIFQMINYATSHKCGVTVHSNFNVFDEAMAEKAVLSGLTHIYLSVDGATQQTYEKYRKNGNLSKVLTNIEIMVRKRKELKSKFPILTWKFLIFPHNVNEIDAAKKKSRDLGVDSFESFYANLGEAATFGASVRYCPEDNSIKTRVARSCDSLWNSLIIYPDGSVIPCCQAFRRKDIFGNVFESPIHKLLNNDDFVSMRKMLRENKVMDAVRYPCCDCGVIRNISNHQKIALISNR